MISFLLAMDEQNLIGKNNDLPWHIPADLAYFKKMTTGKPIVMGRKTFESIGKALPGRENYLITRKDLEYEGVTVLHSIEEFFELTRNQEKEWFVIGGAEIYRQVLPHADRLYITEIHESFEGDTYFPTFSKEEWKETSREKHSKDDRNKYDFDFVIYDRK
ncbi:dihydrofolate reductase [Pseudalkalibacillus hwajinpoensis]|uniref:Dihydrofolate reductase n=1 Tax=Guptibacillus hwajinpoensis TaxID=208199 RepID=A0A4U1MLT5_9BACL|nr:dihydrofolate reductase [Pseudalkalibacillus hwajinpoensis]TKD71512.1 dihydrofolate reductase [Pseudalkalibacillus hwajinpoensis]